MHTYEYRGYTIEIPHRGSVHATEDKPKGNWFMADDAGDAEREIDRIRDDEEQEAEWAAEQNEGTKS